MDCTRATQGFDLRPGGQLAVFAPIRLIRASRLSCSTPSPTYSGKTLRWTSSWNVRPASKERFRCDRPCRKRQASNCCRSRFGCTDASTRARTRTRTASCVEYGSHTRVRLPDRCRIASFCESRRSVSIRSPGLRGIKEVAPLYTNGPEPCAGDRRCIDNRLPISRNQARYAWLAAWPS